MEKVEEENIDAGKHAHETSLHHQQQQQVNLEPLGPGLDGVEAGGETNDAGEHEERKRDAVESEFKTDPEGVEAGRVEREKRVTTRLGNGGVVEPHVQGEEQRQAEADVGQLDRKPLGQAARNRQRDGQRREDS